MVAPVAGKRSKLEMSAKIALVRTCENLLRRDVLRRAVIDARGVDDNRCDKLGQACCQDQ